MGFRAEPPLDPRSTQKTNPSPFMVRMIVTVRPASNRVAHFRSVGRSRFDVTVSTLTFSTLALSIARVVWRRDRVSGSDVHGEAVLQQVLLAFITFVIAIRVLRPNSDSCDEIGNTVCPNGAAYFPEEKCPDLVGRLCFGAATTTRRSVS